MIKSDFFFFFKFKYDNYGCFLFSPMIIYLFLPFSLNRGYFCILLSRISKIALKVWATRPVSYQVKYWNEKKHQEKNGSSNILSFETSCTVYDKENC